VPLPVFLPFEMSREKRCCGPISQTPIDETISFSTISYEDLGKVIIHLLSCKFRQNSGRNSRSGGIRGYFSRNVVPGLLIFRKKIGVR
jgi:hypothetical protein